MKKIFAIITVSVCCGTVAAQPKYTLEQIMDSARHNNIAIRSAQMGVEMAQQQRKSAAWETGMRKTSGQEKNFCKSNCNPCLTVILRRSCRSNRIKIDYQQLRSIVEGD